MAALPPECRAFREALVGDATAAGEPIRRHADACASCRALAGVVERLGRDVAAVPLVTPALRARVVASARRDGRGPLLLSALSGLALLNLVAATLPVVVAMRWLVPLLGSELLAVAAVAAAVAPAIIGAAGVAAASIRMNPAPRRRSSEV